MCGGETLCVLQFMTSNVSTHEDHPKHTGMACAECHPPGEQALDCLDNTYKPNAQARLVIQSEASTNQQCNSEMGTTLLVLLCPHVRTAAPTRCLGIYLDHRMTQFSLAFTSSRFDATVLKLTVFDRSCTSRGRYQIRAQCLPP